MEKTRYAYYNINYHLVWIPKYRRKVLVGAIKADLEIFIHEIAEKMEAKIESLEIQPVHIHLFVSAPPRYSPANLINAFKGATSKRLRTDSRPHPRLFKGGLGRSYNRKLFDVAGV